MNLARASQRFAYSSLTLLIALVIIVTIYWVVLPDFDSRSTCSNNGRASNACTLSRRQETLAYTISSIATVVIVIGVFGILLTIAGVQSTLFIAIMGSMTMLVGLAGNSIVKDVFQGILNVSENQYNVGDWVEIVIRGGGTPVSGVIELASIRRIVVRRRDGSLFSASISDIVSVSNYNRGFARVIANVSGAPKNGDATAPARAVEALRRATVRLTLDPKYSTGIIEPPNVRGVDSADANGIVVSASVKVTAGTQWSIRRALLGLASEEMIRAGLNPSAVYVEAMDGVGKEHSTIPDPK